MNIKKRSHDKEIVEQKLKEANNQLIYMSKTIEDFRNFYNPSKEREEFSIKNACQSVLTIISHLKIEIKVINDGTFYGNKNEFEQVILNIINNARDIFFQREIENPNIEITIKKPTISISDNAQGIEKKYLSKIFEPYFSTKKGSDGIGLYIAKTIVEKEMGGKLTVKSDKKGTKFTIDLSKSIS
jgi:signal transduction histidine kinase